MSIITIDGPSGVGKSAVARALAQTLGQAYLSVGLVYRAFAWLGLKGYRLSVAVIEQLTIKDITGPHGERDPQMFFGEENITSQLYGDSRLEAYCAELAQLWEVRTLAQSVVKSYSSDKSIILEGRSTHRIAGADIIKFFLWADTTERARRSKEEYSRQGRVVELQQLAATTQERDKLDLTRTNNPLRLESDMIAWDSTMATMQETVAQMARIVRHHDGSEPLKISVIIPVYNRSHHLALCLEHLQKQTLPPSQFEVIVVNDGSEENIREVTNQYSVKLIEQPHRGPSTARNQGLRHTTGDILLFLDADILVAADFLEQHLKLHARANNLVVIGSRRHLKPGLLTIDTTAQRDSREALLERYSYNLLSLNYPWSIAYSCNLSIPRNLLPPGGFDEGFDGWGLEDLEFAYRLNHLGARWIFWRAATGYHLFHERTNSPTRFANWQRNLAHFQKRHSTPVVQRLELLAPAFAPAKKANFLDCYDQFNGPKADLRSAIVLDVNSLAGDELVAIQNYIYSPAYDVRKSLVVVGPDETAYGLLQLASSIPSPLYFFPQEVWERLTQSGQLEFEFEKTNLFNVT